MEEGREGARTKGLQKSNPWFRGRLTTPRNHPHTTMGDLVYVSLRVRTWFFTQLWCRMSYGYNTEKTTFLRPDKNCVHFRPPNRKTQLNTNHPCVLVPKF